MEDETFRAAFQASQSRISEMTIRWVEELEPIPQALLEIYCAIAFNTERFNSFKNH